MNRSSTQTKIIVAGIILVLGVLFGLAILSISKHSNEVAVTVTLLPADSTLTVDGVPTKAGKIYFTKHTHTLKVSRQYFTTVTKVVDFTTYDQSQTLYMEPLPDSEQAQQYLVDHPDVQAQREAVSGAQASQAQQELNKNKLIPLLPYSGPNLEYTVDYDANTQPDGSQKVTIYIEADTDQAKQDALGWIKDQNIDPNTLNIVYQNLSTTPPSQSTTDNSNSGGSEYQ